MKDDDQPDLFGDPPEDSPPRALTGEELRDQAIEAVSARHKAWVRAAVNLAITICRQRGRVTSVDVRAILPIPYDADPRILGAVFHRGGPFRRVDWIPNPGRQAHARPIAVWELKEPAVVA